MFCFEGWVVRERKVFSFYLIEGIMGVKELRFMGYMRVFKGFCRMV